MSSPSTFPLSVSKQQREINHPGEWSQAADTTGILGPGVTRIKRPDAPLWTPGGRGQLTHLAPADE